jgi:hypothetical protein
MTFSYINGIKKASKFLGEKECNEWEELGIRYNYNIPEKEVDILIEQQHIQWVRKMHKECAIIGLTLTMNGGLTWLFDQHQLKRLLTNMK